MSRVCVMWFVIFFKQKTAYEMRISDWSSDVCSSDLPLGADAEALAARKPETDALRNGRRPGRPRDGGGFRHLSARRYSDQGGPGAHARLARSPCALARSSRGRVCVRLRAGFPASDPNPTHNTSQAPPEPPPAEDAQPLTPTGPTHH